MQPNLPHVMQEAVKLMAAICIVPPDGHARTIEAITIASEMRGTSGGIGDRFQPIVQGLLVRNEQLRSNCMTLINAIITSPEDVDFRMHLRNEFLREGLMDVLETLGKKHALKRCDQFAINTSCFWGSTIYQILPPAQEAQQAVG